MEFFTRVLSGSSRLKDLRAKDLEQLSQTLQANMKMLKRLTDNKDSEVYALMDMLYDSSFPEEQVFLKMPTKSRLKPNRELLSRLLSGLNATGVPVAGDFLQFLSKHGMVGQVADLLVTFLELMTPMLEDKVSPDFTTDDVLEALDFEWHSNAASPRPPSSPLFNVFASLASSPRPGGTSATGSPLFGTSPFRRVFSERSSNPTVPTTSHEIAAKVSEDKPDSQSYPVLTNSASAQHPDTAKPADSDILNSPQSTSTSTYSLNSKAVAPSVRHHRKSSSLRELFAEGLGDSAGYQQTSPSGSRPRRRSTSRASYEFKSYQGDHILLPDRDERRRSNDSYRQNSHTKPVIKHLPTNMNEDLRNLSLSRTANQKLWVQDSDVHAITPHNITRDNSWDPSSSAAEGESIVQTEDVASPHQTVITSTGVTNRRNIYSHSLKVPMSSEESRCSPPVAPSLLNNTGNKSNPHVEIQHNSNQALTLQEIKFPEDLNVGLVNDPLSIKPSPPLSLPPAEDQSTEDVYPPPSNLEAAGSAHPVLTHGSAPREGWHFVMAEDTITESSGQAHDDDSKNIAAKGDDMSQVTGSQKGSEANLAAPSADIKFSHSDSTDYQSGAVFNKSSIQKSIMLLQEHHEGDLEHYDAGDDSVCSSAEERSSPRSSTTKSLVIQPKCDSTLLNSDNELSCQETATNIDVTQSGVSSHESQGLSLHNSEPSSSPLPSTTSFTENNNGCPNIQNTGHDRTPQENALEIANIQDNESGYSAGLELANQNLIVGSLGQGGLTVRQPNRESSDYSNLLVVVDDAPTPMIPTSEDIPLGITTITLSSPGTGDPELDDNMIANAEDSLHTRGVTCMNATGTYSDIFDVRSSEQQPYNTRIGAIDESSTYTYEGGGSDKNNLSSVSTAQSSDGALHGSFDAARSLTGSLSIPSTSRDAASYVPETETITDGNLNVDEGACYLQETLEEPSIVTHLQEVPSELSHAGAFVKEDGEDSQQPPSSPSSSSSSSSCSSSHEDDVTNDPSSPPSSSSSSPSSSSSSHGGDITNDWSVADKQQQSKEEGSERRCLGSIIDESCSDGDGNVVDRPLPTLSSDTENDGGGNAVRPSPPPASDTKDDDNTWPNEQYNHQMEHDSHNPLGTVSSLSDSAIREDVEKANDEKGKGLLAQPLPLTTDSEFNQLFSKEAHGHQSRIIDGEGEASNWARTDGMHNLSHGDHSRITDGAEETSNWERTEGIHDLTDGSDQLPETKLTYEDVPVQPHEYVSEEPIKDVLSLEEPNEVVPDEPKDVFMFKDPQEAVLDKPECAFLPHQAVPEKPDLVPQEQYEQPSIQDEGQPSSQLMVSSPKDPQPVTQEESFDGASSPFMELDQGHNYMCSHSQLQPKDEEQQRQQLHTLASDMKDGDEKETDTKEDDNMWPNEQYNHQVQHSSHRPSDTVSFPSNVAEEAEKAKDEKGEGVVAQPPLLTTDSEFDQLLSKMKAQGDQGRTFDGAEEVSNWERIGGMHDPSHGDQCRITDGVAEATDWERTDGRHYLTDRSKQLPEAKLTYKHVPVQPHEAVAEEQPKDVLEVEELHQVALDEPKDVTMFKDPPEAVTDKPKHAFLPHQAVPNKPKNVLSFESPPEDVPDEPKDVSLSEAAKYRNMNIYVHDLVPQEQYEQSSIQQEGQPSSNATSQFVVSSPTDPQPVTQVGSFDGASTQQEGGLPVIELRQGHNPIYAHLESQPKEEERQLQQDPLARDMKDGDENVSDTKDHDKMWSHEHNNQQVEPGSHNPLGMVSFPSDATTRGEPEKANVEKGGLPQPRLLTTDSEFDQLLSDMEACGGQSRITDGAREASSWESTDGMHGLTDDRKQLLEAKLTGMDVLVQPREAVSEEHKDVLSFGEPREVVPDEPKDVSTFKDPHEAVTDEPQYARLPHESEPHKPKNMLSFERPPKAVSDEPKDVSLSEEAKYRDIEVHVQDLVPQEQYEQPSIPDGRQLSSRTSSMSSSPKDPQPVAQGGRFIGTSTQEGRGHPSMEEVQQGHNLLYARSESESREHERQRQHGQQESAMEAVVVVPPAALHADDPLTRPHLSTVLPDANSTPPMTSQIHSSRWVMDRPEEKSVIKHRSLLGKLKGCICCGNSSTQT